jgi:hypothetical protein
VLYGSRRMFGRVDAGSGLYGWRLGQGDVVDLKGLIGDKDDHHVTVGAGAVLHYFSFGKPDKTAWSKGVLVGDQRAFEDIHPMPAGVGVRRMSAAMLQYAKSQSEQSSESQMKGAFYIIMAGGIKYDSQGGIDEERGVT